VPRFLLAKKAAVLNQNSGFFNGLFSQDTEAIKPKDTE